MKAPCTDPIEIKKALAERSRGPFRDVLARFLENPPSPAAISEQAEKHPDRWGQALALVARLGGYNEKLEVEGSFSLEIQGLSDSELQRVLSEVESTLDMQSSSCPTQVVDSPSE